MTLTAVQYTYIQYIQYIQYTQYIHTVHTAHTVHTVHTVHTYSTYSTYSTYIQYIQYIHSYDKCTVYKPHVGIHECMQAYRRIQYSHIRTYSIYTCMYTLLHGNARTHTHMCTHIRTHTHTHTHTHACVRTHAHTHTHTQTQVFTPEARLEYLRMFNFLWRAKRMEFTLCAAMVHFINQLQYYITFEVCCAII